jgi:tetratricopeptide (TPR) repeat protein
MTGSSACEVIWLFAARRVCPESGTRDLDACWKRTEIGAREASLPGTDHDPGYASYVNLMQSAPLFFASIRITFECGSHGVGLVELARYEDARKALRHAIRLCPADRLSIPYAQMGHLYKQRGNLRRAATWYRKATVASPTEADGYIFLGSVVALMGDLDQALEWHEQGARSASGCIDEAHYNAGLVLRAMKRYPEAARAFRRALKIDAAYVEAQRALRDVESALKGDARLLDNGFQPNNSNR